MHAVPEDATQKIAQKDMMEAMWTLTMSMMNEGMMEDIQPHAVSSAANSKTSRPLCRTLESCKDARY